MIGGVTRLGWVALSAEVTICHVNVSSWGNPPGRGRVHSKNMYVLKLCTYPSRHLAGFTRNRDGDIRSVKCSHFGIFSVVNRPYFVFQPIPYNVLSQRFRA